MTHEQALFYSFPLTLTLAPRGPGSWVYAAAGHDGDINPPPGDYGHHPGKTSGGSVPMAVPPVLRGDDYAHGDDGLHKYCRTVMCNNIKYGITWGVFATWASGLFRLNRLYLAEMSLAQMWQTHKMRDH